MSKNVCYPNIFNIQAPFWHQHHILLRGKLFRRQKICWLQTNEIPIFEHQIFVGVNIFRRRIFLKKFLTSNLCGHHSQCLDFATRSEVLVVWAPERVLYRMSLCRSTTTPITKLVQDEARGSYVALSLHCGRRHLKNMQGCEGVHRLL